MSAYIGQRKQGIARPPLQAAMRHQAYPLEDARDRLRGLLPKT
jgi:hypothetical protein